MALAKRTIIAVVVGAIVLAVGIGGGVLFGLKYLSPPSDTTIVTGIADPGPMMDLGQFTSTLADPELRVLRVRVMVELAGLDVSARLSDPSWEIVMKDEILQALKDQRFDNIRFTEGMEMLKLDLRSRLNAILPRVNDELAVRRVLFDEFMAQ